MAASKPPADKRVRLTGLRGDIGGWAVGDTFSVVGSGGGVSPLDGSSMLAIDTTSILGDVRGNIYQIVDVTSFAAEIDAGIVTANLSVFYNSNASTDAGLSLHGMDFMPLNFDIFPLLAGVGDGLTVDADANTWEQFTTSAVLPVGIRYLAFGIHEATDAPIAYADNASLTLTYVPIPLPIVLLGTCCAALLGYRKS